MYQENWKGKRTLKYLDGHDENTFGSGGFSSNNKKRNQAPERWHVYHITPV